MSVKHWMTFGTFSSQRYFIYPEQDTYDGVIINGNMAAHAPTGLGAFLVEKTASLPYIIDPLTHAFQHDPVFIKNGEQVKSSIATLCQSYGEPVSSTIGSRRVSPADFTDDVLKGFTERVLDFQLTQLSESMKSSESIKYLEPSDSDLMPYALVAPYFFMTETTVEHWLGICVKAANFAKESKPENKVFSAIIVSQGVVLNEERTKEIIAAFADSAVDGFLLWVDDLNEHKAGSAELRGLLKLSDGLKGNGREVINLHGGYFSVLAAGNVGDGIMSGVAHGPEFGEHRGVVPVGGGIPIAKYYIPDLHTRVNYRDALQYFNEKGWLSDCQTFHRQVCDCDACREVLSNNIENFVLYGDSTVTKAQRGKGMVRLEYPTSQTKERCLKHYLQRKNIEYSDASSLNKSTLLEGLSMGAEKYSDVLGLEGVTHLELWKRVLEEFTAS